MDHSITATRSGDVSYEELVLKAIRDKGSLMRKDVEQIMGQSKFPAIQLLNKLLAEGKIIKTGSAKAVRYTLA
jgi:predicted MarR family transcription regulator